MQILPETTLPRITQSRRAPTRAALERLDHVIVILPESPPASAFRGLPQSAQLKSLAARAEPDDSVASRLANRRSTGITLGKFPTGARFEQLTWARKLVAAAKADKPRQIGILAPALGEQTETAVSAVIAALLAAGFAMPSLKSTPDRRWSIAGIRLLGLADRLDAAIDDVLDTTERLAAEQARYEIQFRADLAELAERIRRPGAA